MLPSEQCSPRNPSRILSLEEEGFGFAVLEAEDLAVATDVEFSLFVSQSTSASFPAFLGASLIRSLLSLHTGLDLGHRMLGRRHGGVGVPCLGRFSHH